MSLSLRICTICIFIFPEGSLVYIFCMTKSVIHYKINAMLKFHSALDPQTCDPAFAYHNSALFKP